MQRRMHRQLCPLVTACDSPGAEEMPLVPGRSGPEFIARLHQLEHFARRCGPLKTNGCSAGPKDVEKRRVGHADVQDAVDPAVQPYSSLDSDRLNQLDGSWHLEECMMSCTCPILNLECSIMGRQFMPLLVHILKGRAPRSTSSWLTSGNGMVCSASLSSPHPRVLARKFSMFSSPLKS